MSSTTNLVFLDLPHPRTGSAHNQLQLARRASTAAAEYVFGLGNISVRKAVAASACAYLLAHTIRESPFIARALAFLLRSGREEPVDPCPDTQLDVVDLASWESFPASDPPGY